MTTIQKEMRTMKMRTRSLMSLTMMIAAMKAVTEVMNPNLGRTSPVTLEVTTMILMDPRRKRRKIRVKRKRSIN